MAEEYRVNSALRWGSILLLAVGTIFFITDEPVVGIGAWGIAGTLLAFLFFRTRDIDLPVASELISTYHKSREIDVPRLFSFLDIRGVKTSHDDVPVLIENEESDISVEWAKKQAWFTSNPRFVEALLLRVFTRLQDGDEVGLATDLRAYRLFSQERLQQYFFAELGGALSYTTTIHALVGDEGVIEVHMIVEEDGSETKGVFPLREDDPTLLNIRSREELLDALFKVCDGYSRRELDRILEIEGRFPSP